MMNVRQKEKLLELALAEEWILEGFSPHEFGTLKGFGPKYVDYVRELRGISVNPVIDLLDPETDSDEFCEPAYVREPATFHSLESGMVDVRVTLALTPVQARWLEGLLQRLPQMHPGQEERHNLGFVINPMLMDVMKSDNNRHGALPSESGQGTMTKADFMKMKGQK